MRSASTHGHHFTYRALAAARLLVVGLFAATAASCAGVPPELREARPGTEQEGMASYYSPRLAGHKTANGERYDPAKFTGAHPALPFGTLVQITRLDVQGREVFVRINDRCAGRKIIIDLSEAAARQLDMIRAGIVRVRLRVLSAPKQSLP